MPDKERERITRDIESMASHIFRDPGYYTRLYTPSMKQMRELECVVSERYATFQGYAPIDEEVEAFERTLEA